MQFVPRCVCFSLASLPPEVMLHMHYSTARNLEIAPPISKKVPKWCAEWEWTNRSVVIKKGYTYFRRRAPFSPKKHCTAPPPLTKNSFSRFIRKIWIFLKTLFNEKIFKILFYIRKIIFFVRLSISLKNGHTP